MKELARGVRQEYGLIGPRVMRSDLRRIYKAKNIQLDYWPYPLKKLRGAYFNDENGVSVMVAKSLPDGPAIFTLAHELKHHLADRETGRLECSAGNESDPVEIGAEVFAAEFLFPELLFKQAMEQMVVEPLHCVAETLVRLKHDTKTTLSYAGLVKKAEWLGFATKGTIKPQSWQRLEDQIYGVPFYRQKRI